jgi:hypothetical protein
MTIDLEVNDSDAVTFTATFTTPAGTPTNPDDVSFSFGTETSLMPTVWVFGTDPQVTNPSPGVFVATVDTTGMTPVGDTTVLTAQFNAQADTSGNIQVAGYSEVLIRPMPYPNPLINL